MLIISRNLNSVKNPKFLIIRKICFFSFFLDPKVVVIFPGVIVFPNDSLNRQEVIFGPFFDLTSTAKYYFTK